MIVELTNPLGRLPEFVVPLVQEDATNDQLEEPCLVLVAAAAVPHIVALDDGPDDAPLVFDLGKLGLLDLMSCPASVEVQTVILDQRRPALVHVVGSEASLYRVPLG